MEKKSKTSFSRSIKAPGNGGICLITLMAIARAYASGVMVFDSKGRQRLLWIPIPEEDGVRESVRQARFEVTQKLLQKIIDNPHRSRQPDWRYLDDESVLFAMALEMGIACPCPDDDEEDEIEVEEYATDFAPAHEGSGFAPRNLVTVNPGSSKGKAAKPVSETELLSETA
jgi:hypothetical protein